MNDFNNEKFENTNCINVFLSKNRNKKHAKVQKFMQIDCKILSLQPLILY